MTFTPGDALSRTQAYQVLRHGGLKDDNVVVMMYDDLASNPDNPVPGRIFNHPRGQDVYAGVPKVPLPVHCRAPLRPLPAPSSSAGTNRGVASRAGLCGARCQRS